MDEFLEILRTAFDQQLFGEFQILEVSRFLDFRLLLTLSIAPLVAPLSFSGEAPLLVLRSMTRQVKSNVIKRREILFVDNNALQCVESRQAGTTRDSSSLCNIFKECAASTLLWRAGQTA